MHSACGVGLRSSKDAQPALNAKWETSCQSDRVQGPQSSRCRIPWLTQGNYCNTQSHICAKEVPSG